MHLLPTDIQSMPQCWKAERAHPTRAKENSFIQIENSRSLQMQDITKHQQCIKLNELRVLHQRQFCTVSVQEYGLGIQKVQGSKGESRELKLVIAKLQSEYSQCCKRLRVRKHRLKRKNKICRRPGINRRCLQLIHPYS